jgi:hypothetical protein
MSSYGIRQLSYMHFRVSCMLSVANCSEEEIITAEKTKCSCNQDIRCLTSSWVKIPDVYWMHVEVNFTVIEAKNYG